MEERQRPPADKPPTTRPALGAPQGGPPAAASSAGSTPQAATPRRRGRFPAWAVVAGALLLVSCLASAAVVAYLGYRQSGAKREVREALEAIATAEAALGPIDEMLAQDFVTLEGVDLDSVASRMESASALLAQELPGVISAEGRSPGAFRKIASRTTQLVEAELKALSSGREVVDAAREGKRALPPARRGWADILDERELVASAVDAYNKDTEAAVRSSSILYKRALAKVRSARFEYASAAEAFPRAELADLREYLRLRQAHVSSALRINDKYLAGDKEGANALSRGYNSAGETLLDLLNGVPSPQSTRPVSDGVRAVAADALAAYGTARQGAQQEALALQAAIGSPS